MKKAVTKGSATKRMNDLKSGKAAPKSKKKRVPLKKSYEVVRIAERNPYKLKGKAKKQKKDGRGRPTVMTKEVVRKLEEAFSFDCPVLEACLFVGISRETYYKFLKENPDFTDRVEELREAGILVARRTVLSRVEYDADTALKYLERKKKNEFSTKKEVALEGNIRNQHVLPDGQADLIKKAMGGFMGKMKQTAK